MKNFYKWFANIFLILLFALAIIMVVLPDREYSSTEKRSLASFPRFSISSLMDGSFMDGIEEWAADQFPFRDQLMQVKSKISLSMGAIRSQNVYRSLDGSLMEAFTMPSGEILSEQSEAITDFMQRYPDSAFYFCLVPNAVSIETEKLPKATLTDDQNLYIDYMEKSFDDLGTFVDVRNVFNENKENMELYYHTDHHWTTDAAYLAWQELYSAMELNSTVSYTSGVVCNSFSGSLLSASGFPASSYDAIKIYMPDVDPVYTVTYDNAQKMTASVYSMKHLKGDDPYQIFFDGNHPKITIRTEADTERKLLVLKDSYANCLIPFLIPDFSQITIIDARYYYDDLDLEMQSAGYTDVLFLYNVNTLSLDNSLVPVLNNEQYLTPDTDTPSGEENTSTDDTSSPEDNSSTEDETAAEDNSHTDDTSTGDATDPEDNIHGNVGSILSINDVAFIGDSRTLSMATGGRLAYNLIPDTSIFATWGGKITDATAKTNTQTAAEANKKMAIFWFGINDVQSSDLAIRNDVEQFHSNYEDLIDLYRQANPKDHIVVLSILTTSTQEKDYYEGQEENIQAYNKELQKLCGEKGYTYLDITSLYTGDDCFAEGDYIHFSKEWYESTFLPYISDVLKLRLD